VSGGGGAAPTGLVPAPRESLSLFAPSDVPSIVIVENEFAEIKKVYREAASVLLARGAGR